jgi:hypothetical protein
MATTHVVWKTHSTHSPDGTSCGGGCASELANGARCCECECECECEFACEFGAFERARECGGEAQQW